MGNCVVFRVLHASRGLPAVRRQGRAGSLGGRQEPDHEGVPVVPGGWARRMSWKEVSEAFRVSWDCVYAAVKQAVSWGLEHRDLEGIEAIGVDEVQWQKGHKYQTVVYQLDEHNKRLLWIGPDRKAKTLLRFFRFLGKSVRAAAVHLQRHVAGVSEGDRKKAPQAVHVLDRFHIMQRMSKAIKTCVPPRSSN